DHSGRDQQVHLACLGGGGAVVAYSASVSHPLWSASAPWNFSIDLAAHSSNDSEPLPLASSLANALRRAPNISSDSILPSLCFSAREKRRSSRSLGVASGAAKLARVIEGLAEPP